MDKNSTLTGRCILILTLIFALATSAKAQTSPNLKFARPVLSSGIAGHEGATYKFANVIIGVDAFVTIDKITNNATLVNIDDTTTGYYNAWQPIVGGPGTTGQSSEIRWVINFKNTDGSKHKFPNFDLSAIDIDGDNVRIREYINVNGQNSYNLPTAVPTLMNISTVASPDYNNDGEESPNDLKGLGPVLTRNGIDTTALNTRMNYKFTNKDKIKVTTGAQVDNNGNNGAISTARYYSMYFKPVSNIIVTGVLPVTLRTFDVVATNNKSTNLYWITDAEMANNYFEVERSFDQKDFRTIGLVLGAQTTTNSANQYSFKDGSTEIASHSIIYYRLKQIDMDENFSFSSVKMVRLSSNTKTFVQVYPNPCMEKLNINFVADESGKAEIRLVSTTGQMVSLKENEITKGYNNFQMNNLNAVASGIYVAELVVNGKTIASQKVIKE